MSDASQTRSARADQGTELEVSTSLIFINIYWDIYIYDFNLKLEIVRCLWS